MNFSYSRGDDPDHVLENFTRMAAALGVERDRMVASYQTHTTNVRRVTEEDLGKGVVRTRDYRDVDGLITNLPGVTLVTFYADCVPLYLVDPVKKAIGLSHSGWRGTVARMGRETVEAMKREFGTDLRGLFRSGRGSGGGLLSGLCAGAASGALPAGRAARQISAGFVGCQPDHS